MFKCGINHTRNAYCSAVMATKEILCLQQGQYEQTKAYYQRFEAAISTYDLEKCMAMTHVGLKKTHARGDNHNGINRFQVMCLIISYGYEQYQRGTGRQHMNG